MLAVEDVEPLTVRLTDGATAASVKMECNRQSQGRLTLEQLHAGKEETSKVHSPFGRLGAQE